jgi:hypothetical protein
MKLVDHGAFDDAVVMIGMWCCSTEMCTCNYRCIMDDCILLYVLSIATRVQQDAHACAMQVIGTLYRCICSGQYGQQRFAAWTIDCVCSM